MSFPTPAVAGDQVSAQDFNDFTLNPVYTYGETLAAGDWVYLKAADGKIWKGSATVQAQVDAFVGVIITAGVANDTNRILAPGKIVSGLSGLTAGAPVYLGDTAGALSMSPGTFPYIIGVTLSTSSLVIIPFNERNSINEFGNGSDGELALDGTNTFASILSKSGANYTALRNIFATNIIFSGSATLNMAGYKLYASGTVSGTGTIFNDGQPGGVGGNSGTSDGGTRGAGGSQGAPGVGITVPSPATSGGGGQSDYDTGSAPGSAGSNAAIGYSTTAGSAGGAGGAGGGGGGAAGAGGTVTSQIGWRPYSITEINDWFQMAGDSLSVMRVGPGAGGGGGGALPGGAGTPSSGGGGGGGGHGGFLFCAIANITGSITFRAKGGAGGNGGNGTEGTNRNGGGGGGGGNGGIILLVYRYSAGYTTDVTGGAAGTGGTASGGSTNTSGSNGNAGSAGTVIALQLK